MNVRRPVSSLGRGQFSGISRNEQVINVVHRAFYGNSEQDRSRETLCQSEGVQEIVVDIYPEAGTLGDSHATVDDWEPWLHETLVER